MLGTINLGRKVIGDWLRSEESSGSRWSRDNIEVVGGNGLLITGTVLSKSQTGAAQPNLAPDNTGNGTISDFDPADGAQAGIYQINFTSPTAFDVVYPDGTATAGTVGTAHALGFTITAGSTAFVAGDAGGITIERGSGLYSPITAAGTPAGILVEDVHTGDTNNGPVRGAAVVRHAYIAPSGLTFPAAATSAEKAAILEKLKTLGIHTVREA